MTFDCKYWRLVKIKIVVILLLTPIFGFGQTDTEFWFSAPEVNRYHVSGTDALINPPANGNYGTPVYLHLTSFDKPANVTISMPANALNFHGGTPIIVALPANTTQRIDLSPYVGDNVAGVNSLTSMENKLRWATSDLVSATPYINKNNKGILIQSDNIITTYYEIGVLYNMDLISLKGRNALGKQFFVPFQTTNNTATYNFNYRPYSSIDIVATEDNTKIKVTTAVAIWVRGVGSKPAGIHTIWLNAGETSIITPYENQAGFQYQTTFSSALRLAGSYVEVDETEGSGAAISVISHDDLVKSNFSGNPDYVTDQLVPIKDKDGEYLIGTDYAVIQGVGFSPTEIEDWIFVVGTQPGTNIAVKTGPTANPNNYVIGAGVTQAISLNNSGYNVATIKSDLGKPVYVYHMSGAGRQKAGALIPTISNCTGSGKVAFNRTRPNPYAFYLNILVWNTAMGKFKLKTNNLDVSTPAELGVLAAINNPLSFKALPEAGAPYSNWSYARIDASALTANLAYLLVNDENVFHLGVINGVTGNDAFYGYFSNFNQFTVDGTVGPSVSPEIKLCYGASTQLYANGGTKFTWSPIDFLDDPNVYNPNVIFPTVSTKYKVVSKGACNLKDSAYVKVNVSAPLTPSFTADTVYGCGSLPVKFTNTSAGGPTKLYWYWKVRGTPNPGTQFKTSNLLAVPLPVDAHNATHTFTNATAAPITYIVNLLVESPSCSAVDSMSIVVYPSVSVTPTVSVNNGCNPLNVQLFANPTGYTGTASITWDFGDGGSAAILNPTHTFNNINPVSQLFTSKVKIVDQWNICKDSNTVNVTVQPFIKASFVINKIEGCSPLDVDIINDSRGGITQWIWDRDLPSLVDDFSGEGSGTRTYTNPTVTNTVMTIPIRLKVTNAWGCVDEITRTINVFPQAAINTYTLNDNLNPLGCSPLNMDFTATTTNATIFHWLIDGNAFNNTVTANYNFDNFGAGDVVKTASFTANNQYGCLVTQTSNITIRPYVDAQFVADKEVGCSPLSVGFINASSIGSSNYQWFIDGALFSTTTNIPSQLFSNPTVTNVPRIIPVRLVASNAIGCTDDLTKNIVVNPQTVASFTYTDAANLNHCSPFSTTFTSDPTNNETYQWEFGSYGASNIANPTFNFINNAIGDVTVPVTLTTNNSSGCPAISTQNIIVRPGVKALFSIDKTAGCPPYDATVAANTAPAIINYTWDFDSTPFTGANQIFSNPSNLTGLDVTKNISLTVSSGFCSDNVIKSIVVYPQVEALFTPIAVTTGCSPFTANFENTSRMYGTNAPITNIVWDFKDNSTAITSPLNHTFVNPDNTNPQLFNVTLTATTNNGCTDVKTIPITVNPNVTAAFNSLVLQPCTPVRINIKDASVAGPTISTFTWTYTGGVLLPPEDKDFDIDFDNIDPNNPITRTVTLDISNTFGCISSKSQNFIIDPKVNVALALTAPVDGGGVPIDRQCAPALFTFSNNSTGAGLTYTWDFKDGVTQTVNTIIPFDHTFENRTAATKQFDVQLSAVNLMGCTNSATRSVWAYPEVDAKYSMTRDSSCTPFYIKLKDESLNGTQWSWDFGHTILGIPQTRTSIVPGETFTKLIDNETVTDQIKKYKINLTLDDLVTGCKDTISQFLEVYPRVISNFTVTPISDCSPITINFTNNSTGLGSYLWELDNGISFTQPNPIPLSITNTSTVNEKVVNVKLTATNTLNCKSVSNRTVTIAPQVLASFTSSILEGCDPFTANFFNLTPSTAYNYSWSVDGVPQVITQDYSRAFTNLTNPPVINKYKVLLESSYKLNATCKDTISKFITVYPRVYPNFSFSNTVGCHPLTTDLTNSTVSFNNTASYTWDLGNGTFSTLQDLTDQKYKNNSATKDTIYSIKLIARSIHQCVDSISRTVTVHPRPIASYIMNNESVKCSPFDIELHNHSIGTSLVYDFDLDDGPIITTADRNQIITHTYHNITNDVTSYNIVLTATTAFGCSNSTSQTVFAYPEVKADLTLTANAGCSPLTVGFEDESDNGYFNQWSFGDGTNSNLLSPSHRFVNTKNKDKFFDVHLRSISAYDCEDDTTVQVTVYATPVANFSVNPPLKTFPDATFNFHNQSNPDTVIWAHDWIFGDGFTSNAMAPTDHTYLQWGPKNNDFIYNTRLIVTAPHCADTTFNILRLLPAAPIPFFTADIYKSCSPLEAHFVNASEYGNNFEWSFGDGSPVSTEEEPIHRFTEPGYYIVKLTVFGDGGDSYYYRTFRVFQNPVASFAVYPNHVMLPEAEVHIYNLTKYAHRYEWDLGDGTITYDKDPVHKYEQLGEYRISLRAFSHDTLGPCQDYTTVFPAVWVEGQGVIKFPDAFVPSKLGSNGGVFDEIDYKNEVFHPIHYGVVEYKLMIFNRWGEQIFQSDDVKQGWDGYYKGKLCDQGVYIWRAIGKYTNGRAFDQKGNLTLLR